MLRHSVDVTCRGCVFRRHSPSSPTTTFSSAPRGRLKERTASRARRRLPPQTSSGAVDGDHDVAAGCPLHSCSVSGRVASSRSCCAAVFGRGVVSAAGVVAGCSGCWRGGWLQWLLAWLLSCGRVAALTDCAPTLLIAPSLDSVVGVARAHAVLYVEGPAALAATKGLWTPVALSTADKKPLQAGYAGPLRRDLPAIDITAVTIRNCTVSLACAIVVLVCCCVAAVIRLALPLMCTP